ncbi:isochorismatase isochorismatase [Streptomyces sp. F-3]|jgi:isochorismate hydrolase|uniref:isochorismatase family protein n=1 Tax=Streptomyces TaxID=1883 RepID=UPI0007C3DF91|nr:MULTISPECIES: isochorismatase family protein [Streptomyces]MDN5384036.1 isochorismatase family protein [Streptomyces sp. LB8]GAT84341.1 isochorismatase isochorismatase [Streptomyces sp. F-3]
MAGIPTIEPYPMPTAGELPVSTAPWAVDPARAVLLVHDMQRYFLSPLPTMLRTTLVDHVTLLRERCARLGVPVAYTAQPGDMTDTQRGLLKDFWGPGMRAAPADRAIVEQIAPRPGDWMLTKWRYSAFFRTDLLSRMRAHGRDQLVVCGVYAHIGVLASAIESFSHDIETFLVADAVADFSRDDHWMALRYAARRCAVLTTAKETFA